MSDMRTQADRTWPRACRACGKTLADEYHSVGVFSPGAGQKISYSLCHECAREEIGKGVGEPRERGVSA